MQEGDTHERNTRTHYHPPTDTVAHTILRGDMQNNDSNNNDIDKQRARAKSREHLDIRKQRALTH